MINTFLQIKNTNFCNVDNLQYIDEINKNMKLFDIDETKNLELYDHIKIVNGPINKELLIETMKKENFIFIEKN